MPRHISQCLNVYHPTWIFWVVGSLCFFACTLAWPQETTQISPNAVLSVPGIGSHQGSGDQIQAFHEGTYRGQIGSREVQVQLVLDRSAEDSVTGSYFFFGEGTNILLAGEFEGNQLHLEESKNGIDVSGTWDATMDSDHLRGTWNDDGETVHLNFDLRRIGPATKT